MPKLVLVPNKMGSKSVKELAKVLSNKLGYKVFRVSIDRVRNRLPIHFKRGTDKLAQLEAFTRNGIPCPEYTTDRNTAINWINNGDVVMCRTLLRASEGRGIVVAETIDQIVNAPLYTKYVPKKEEYRVHVFRDEVIDVQQKRKRGEFDGTRNSKIRNLANGYVFCRDGISEPALLRELAIKATRSLGYSLGAVDVAYNVKKDKLVVLEVNATPGMQGTTLERYANQILKSVRNITV